MFKLLAALINRHSQREQARATAFEEFLCKLGQAQNHAAYLLHDLNVTGYDEAIGIVDAYAELEDYARVVRLYLPRGQRDEFAHLVREIRAFHGGTDLGDSRLLLMEKRISRIQQIFEGALSPLGRLAWRYR